MKIVLPQHEEPLWEVIGPAATRGGLSVPGVYTGSNQYPFFIFDLIRNILIVFMWPSGRVFSAKWTDKEGNFWMFGGNGTGSTDAVHLDSMDINMLVSLRTFLIM